MELSRQYKGANKGALIIFFIQPFLGFLLAIANLKSKFSFPVIFLFFVLFGYTFIAENKSADSYRYIQEFTEYSTSNSFQYKNDLKEYVTFKSNIKDIYTISSFYVVSRFTKNYHILMALWAAIFSFFFLKSLRFFVQNNEYKRSLIVALLTLLFIYSNNIFNINGVRFWTAAWIAVYAVFEIVVNRKPHFFLLSLITPLIHISYLFFVSVLVVFILTQKFQRFWILLFIISFFVSEISIELILNFNDSIPKILQNVVLSYASEDNLRDKQNIVDNLPTYARILNNLPRYFINLIMFVFIYNTNKIKLIKKTYPMFIFLLIWLSFVNFTMPVPSFGGRFIVLSVPFICYLSLLSYKNIAILPKLIYLIPFIYSYSILDWLRNMITVTDPYLFFSVFPNLIIKNIFS